MTDKKSGMPYTGTGKPTHVPGVKQGNRKGNYERMAAGHCPDGTSRAARSTGIRPKAEEPIAPSMPDLSPA